MVTLDGKPLVDEATARLDLATEFGILYANFRNIALEREALAKALQSANDELAQVKQSCVTLGEKYRDMTANRDALAAQIRGKATKPKKA
jgi:hypothetical protein